jgi:hypothetical protein
MDLSPDSKKWSYRYAAAMRLPGWRKRKNDFGYVWRHTVARAADLQTDVTLRHFLNVLLEDIIRVDAKGDSAAVGILLKARGGVQPAVPAEWSHRIGVVTTERQANQVAHIQHLNSSVVVDEQKGSSMWRVPAVLELNAVTLSINEPSKPKRRDSSSSDEEEEEKDELALSISLKAPNVEFIRDSGPYGADMETAPAMYHFGSNFGPVCQQWASLFSVGPPLPKPEWTSRQQQDPESNECDYVVPTNDPRLADAINAMLQLAKKIPGRQLSVSVGRQLSIRLFPMVVVAHA